MALLKEVKMQFKTPFNGLSKISGEDYSKVKSITQPEQVLPFAKIVAGLKNGTIFLPDKPQHFDIPEHEIDVPSQTTPEGTNAAVSEAVARDLAETAAQAGEDITAAPGFTVEDGHPIADFVEAAIAEAESEKSAGHQKAQADEIAEAETVAKDSTKSVNE